MTPMSFFLKGAPVILRRPHAYGLYTVFESGGRLAGKLCYSTSILCVFVHFDYFITQEGGRCIH